MLGRAGLLGGAGVALGGIGAGCSTDGRSRAASPSTTAAGLVVGDRPDRSDRVLVVVELSGGNDGLSTVVPVDDDHYRRLRPTLALGHDDVVDLGDGFGINRLLADLPSDRLAVLMGVGVARSTMSHFDMLGRWWSGSAGAGQTGPPTGFLGRTCDELGEGDLVGVSIGQWASPAMTGRTGRTVGLPSGRSLVADGSDGSRDELFAALGAMARGGGRDALGAARTGTERMLRVDDHLAGLLPATSDAYAAAGDFGRRLAFASQLIRSDVGVRVVHLSFNDAPFDTHEGHREMHSQALGTVAAGLRAFLGELDSAGLGERVLVATTSEFGRRIEEHNGGLDHGAASCALLIGPVSPGLHGDPPPLSDPDADGNLRTTVPHLRYYATLARWLGVDPAAVLPDAPRPIDSLLRV
jgi:uncharacterized protein (DUF1501 family)